MPTPNTAWATWLRARLEGFAIDKDLAGRDTGRGPVPKRGAGAAPEFRNREDFSDGHSLMRRSRRSTPRLHSVRPSAGD
jgi:hypothetical protein